MVNMARELIRILGIDTTRLRLEWISSAEGARFAEVAREFTENVAALGPSSLKQAA
jgi:coenzyme F420-reducing hydrogenase delta subunit